MDEPVQCSETKKNFFLLPKRRKNRHAKTPPKPRPAPATERLLWPRRLCRRAFSVEVFFCVGVKVGMEVVLVLWIAVAVAVLH